MFKTCVVSVGLLALLTASTRAQEVYDPGNGVTLPVVVKEIHLMGATPATVGIACVVTADGTIDTATVATSPDANLNDVAIRAVRQWRFRPGLKDGKPVAVRIFVLLTIERS